MCTAILPRASIRTHVLLLVVLGALVPLSVVGVWLASSSIRAGEELLEGHLSESADRFVAAAERRWTYRRADMLWLAESEVARKVLLNRTVTRSDSEFFAAVRRHAGVLIPDMSLRGLDGTVFWATQYDGETVDGPGNASARSSATGTAERTIGASFPVKDEDGSSLGEARFRVLLTGIIPADSARPLVPGSRVAVRSRTDEEVLLPLTTSVSFPSGASVMVADREWRVATRVMATPGIELAVAAPLENYVLMFQRNATKGLLWLAVVAVLVLTFTIALTVRLAGPIERLTEAAEGISRGQLGLRIEGSGPAEVRRLGGAFDTMTRSLRDTLDSLSQRNALVAVGEFATALSHDVRNALMSIKLDLQRASRRNPPDSQSLELVERSLNTVTRLEAAVSGALRVARGERMSMCRVDLRDAARASAEMVQGAFHAVPARLVLELPDDPIWIHGDAAALEQLFANILFNAAQALRADGEASVEVRREGAAVDVFVRDNGVGMSAQELESLQGPFHSSKRDGHGLGIPIARQIALTHSGTLEISSAKGKGTTVRVSLPAATSEFPTDSRPHTPFT